MEKRRHNHIPVNAFVRFYPEPYDEMFQKHYQGVVKNYSKGGMCILTEHPLPKGCPVAVELPIESEMQGMRIVELRGVVRWVRQFEGKRGMGIEFFEFAGAADEDFTTWMSNLIFDGEQE